MNISIINNDKAVVYLKNELFSRNLNVLNRIREIGNTCGFLTNFTANSNIVFYFEMQDFKKMDNKEYIINNNTEKILGFLRVEKFPKFLEIYDVCVNPEYRGRGIMTIIFQNLINSEIDNFEYFWLGVIIDDPNRDKNIKLYLSVGFKFKEITSSKLNGEKLPFVIISMTLQRKVKNSFGYYIPGFLIKTVKETNQEIFNGLNNLYCTIKLCLLYQDAKFINDNYSSGQNTEYGGIMIGFKELNYYILKPKDIVKGETFSVNTPYHHINWHTHPNICYKNNRCYIGWPSGKDMEYIFFQYVTKGLLLHFLFAFEGVYVIRLTKEMMAFIHIISNNQIWIQDISDLILYRFNFLEGFRTIKEDLEKLKCKDDYLKCLSYLDPERKESIKNIFLNRANNKTLRDYIVQGQEYTDLLFNNFPIDEINKGVEESINYYEKFSNTKLSFPVFKVEFYTPEQIKNNLYFNLDFLQSPNNPFCPV